MGQTKKFRLAGQHALAEIVYFLGRFNFFFSFFWNSYISIWIMFQWVQRISLDYINWSRLYILKKMIFYWNMNFLLNIQDLLSYEIWVHLSFFRSCSCPLCIYQIILIWITQCSVSWWLLWANLRFSLPNSNFLKDSFKLR